MAIDNDTNGSTPGIDITVVGEPVFERSALLALAKVHQTIRPDVKGRAGTIVLGKGNRCVVGEHIHTAEQDVREQCAAAATDVGEMNEWASPHAYRRREPLTFSFQGSPVVLL